MGIVGVAGDDLEQASFKHWSPASTSTPRWSRHTQGTAWGTVPERPEALDTAWGTCGSQAALGSGAPRARIATRARSRCTSSTRRSLETDGFDRLSQPWSPTSTQSTLSTGSPWSSFGTQASCAPSPGCAGCSQGTWGAWRSPDSSSTSRVDRAQGPSNWQDVLLQ